MPTIPTATKDRERVQHAMSFQLLGFRDYVGARSLLLSNLPLQGAILASTAVEKYIKALLGIAGKPPHGHLHRKHLNLLKSFFPEMYLQLNEEFLAFLQEVYVLRYVDRLPSNFNLSVYAREVLAELDYTVGTLETKIWFRRGENDWIDTALKRALKARDPLVVNENYLVASIEKTEFLSKPDSAYAVRDRPGQSILEIEFSVPQSLKDGKFMREALIPVDPSTLKPNDPTPRQGS